MAIPKVLGTETEYGHGLHHPGVNIVQDQFALAPKIVEFVAQTCQGVFVCWDYFYERGLFDLFTLQKSCDEHERPPPSPAYRFIGSLEQDVILPNGARVYTDHGHPEYSTPECLTVRELVAQEKAGERCLESARKKIMALYKESSNDELELLIYKNNNDYYGHSFGAHENYLVDRNARKMEEVMHELVPHLVTRILYCGAGDIKDEQNSSRRHYELSQRAEFFTQLSGIGTMQHRPIFNTRDEPHADETKFIRLHVIPGDANMSEYCIFLKNGTTAIILQMCEDKLIELDSIMLDNPITAFHEISKDIRMEKTYTLKNGKKFSAINIQEYYLEKAQKYAADCGTQEQNEVVREWAWVLDKLRNDPHSLNKHIDWIIKYDVVTRFMESKNISWNNDVVRSFSMRYHDIRDEGIYNRLCAQNAVVRIISDDDIANAITHPPETTRAFFRANAVKKFGKNIKSVNWESVVGCGGEEIKLNPLSGTKQLIGKKLESAQSFEQLKKEVFQ